MSDLKNYMVEVCELDAAGRIMGTHHVSSHAVNSPEEAKEAAIAETQADWIMGDDEALHVLFVMAAPNSVALGALGSIELIEYDEGAT